MTLKNKTFNMPEGEITFCEWTNKQELECVNNAMQRIPDNIPKYDKVLMMEVEVWKVAMSIFNGSGYLKKKTLQETYDGIQALPISSSYLINKEFMDFCKELSGDIGDLKKK